VKKLENFLLVVSRLYFEIELAGLLTSPRRAHFKITEKGQGLLKENLPKIDVVILNRYPEFIGFQSAKKSKVNGTIDETHLFESETDKTPEEALWHAFQKLFK
jgi:restriction system protein